MVRKPDERDAMCRGPHPFIPGQGVAKFELRFNTTNDISENVIYVQHVDLTAWSLSQLTAMCNTIGTAWAANLKAVTTSTIDLADIKGTDWSTQTGPEVDVLANNPGSDAHEALPNGTTLSVKFQTAKRGRSFRGRVFQIGVTDQRAFTDQFSDTYAQAIKNGWGAMLTAINAVANCQMVIFSQCSGGAWRVAGVATPVTSVALTDNLVDYQRRRSEGHSRHC